MTHAPVPTSPTGLADSKVHCAVCRVLLYLPDGEDQWQHATSIRGPEEGNVSNLVHMQMPSGSAGLAWCGRFNPALTMTGTEKQVTCPDCASTLGERT